MDRLWLIFIFTFINIGILFYLGISSPLTSTPKIHPINSSTKCNDDHFPGILSTLTLLKVSAPVHCCGHSDHLVVLCCREGSVGGAVGRIFKYLNRMAGLLDRLSSTFFATGEWGSGAGFSARLNEQSTPQTNLIHRV